MIHQSRSFRRPVAAFLLAAGFACGQAHSEVSVDVTGTGPNPFVFAQIVNGGEPIGPGVWRQFRPIAAALVLNAAGLERGDGRPEIVTLLTRAPLAVWAYNNGPEHDIMTSEWSGTAWGVFAPIATSAANEIDPRAYVDSAGNVSVVWWEDAPSKRVLWSSRPAGSSLWSPPMQVNPPGEPASRPSIVDDGGQVKIAYERPSLSPPTGQQIVLATRQGDGSFVYSVIAATPRLNPLDPILNATDGKLWVDWMEDGQSFGCARWTGSEWQQSTVVPWSDGSWLGIEDFRRVVRTTVLSVQ